MEVGVSPVYYDLTHRIVGQLKDSGLEKISKATNIPFNSLQAFRDKKELSGEYIPALYSHLFQNMTFLEANAIMDKAGW